MGNARSFKRRANAHQSGDSGTVTPIGADSRNSGRSVLWFANAPWAGTGYGTQTAQVVARLNQQGIDTAINVNYGFEAGNTVYKLGGKDTTVYGSGFGQWRNDSIKANALHFSQITGKPPTVITLCDVWTFPKDCIDEIPVLSWVPIDHAPVPPKVADWCRIDNVTPIAMSQFGQAMLEGADIACEYAPHAFEPVFTPTPVMRFGEEQRTGREILGIPDDAFVVMINNANKGVTPNRKAFGENLLAFSMFAAKHDDVILYLHTERHGAMGGIDLDKLVRACNIPEHKVRFVDQYAYRNQIGNHILAGFYTMADVLLCATRGEGFGIPVIEAQACGTRVIVSDWSAQPELVVDGWKVNIQPEWDAMQDTWFATPLVHSIVEALEEAYNAGGGHSQAAVDGIAPYGADAVFETHWKPILNRAGVL